jgi:hypothetical protein
VDSTVVRTSQTQSIGGTKTFTNTIIGSITGQSGLVANALTPGDGLSFTSGATYNGAVRLSDARPASSINTTTDGFVKTINTDGTISIVSTVNYNELTGTVPIWNQDTTGNASTATNVAYSGLTGTVPIWNQDTTGNASTAT